LTSVLRSCIILARFRLRKGKIMWRRLRLLSLSKCRAVKNQGCGSGLIQSRYGSGSSIIAQSGSGCGSGTKLKQNFRRQFLSQICLKLKFESNQKYRCYSSNFFKK
jgi:hypothetical protein